jgi:hypothetical protein
MTRWDWMPVIIYDMTLPGLHQRSQAHIFIHFKFFTGSASDDSGKLFTFDLKSGWN